MTQLKLRPLARTRTGVIAVGALILCGLLALAATTLARRAEKTDEAELAGQSRRVGALFYPAPKQWASLTIEPGSECPFRAKNRTKDKTGVDEDRATRVYSP